MAWIANIAGKAEDFLNKIDQSTADVLKNSDEASLKSSRSRKKKQPQIQGHEQENFSSVLRNSQSFDSTSVPNSATTVTVINPFPTDNTSHVEIENSSSSGTTCSRSSSRPKPPRPSKLRNSNSLTSASQGKSDKTAENKVETSISIHNGFVAQPNDFVIETTDEQLLDFLNSPSQHLDESSLLKNEIASQTREMGLLLHNYKKLQQDYEAMKKSYEFSLRQKESDTDTQFQLNTTFSSDANLVSSAEHSRQLQEKYDEIDNLRTNLKTALEKLEQTDDFQNIKNRHDQLELEKCHIVSENEELKSKINALSSQLENSVKQIEVVKEKLNVVEDEYSTYKDKAKSILKTKDELIANMSSNSVDHNRGSLNSDIPSVSVHAQPNELQFLSEIGSLRSERELLHAEITQNRFYADSLREENSRLESEMQTLRAANANLHSLLSKEKHLRHHHQEENLHLSQQISSLQLDFERIRIEKLKVQEKLDYMESNNLKASNSMRKSNSFNDFDMDKYQQQAGNISSAAYEYGETENLRTRITALSQNLLEKQNYINALTSDKQLLQLRIERLQAKMQEMSQEVEYHQSGEPFSFSNDGLVTHSVVSNQPLYLSESPWDSRIARRVKRAYAQVDTMCCQVGLILRQRPNIRLGFCVYILCLHFWVLFILFSWSHSHTPELPDTK